MAKSRGFNMIGFRSYIDVLPPSCSECHAVLIKNPKEASQLMCPLCGLIPEEELIQKMEAEQNKPELTIAPIYCHILPYNLGTPSCM